jgi:IS5 family transposase
MMEKVISTYHTVPCNSAVDGGYASLPNQAYAQKKGTITIVFNKGIGRMQNSVSNKNMEMRLLSRKCCGAPSRTTSA